MAKKRPNANATSSDEGWTLAELVRRARLALGDVQAPNGRVTAMPDARVIRWYATIGLIDRPIPGPGREARYGPRHLRQLVAVKRRQAAGRSLAEIQTELGGAPDALLDPIAQLTAELLVAGIPVGDDLSARGGHDRGHPIGRVEVDLVPDRGATFWVDRSFASHPHESTGSGSHPRDVVHSDAATRSRAPDPTIPAGEPEPVALHGVRLGDLVLLLPRAPDGEDLEALRSAARPLIDLLADRGLLMPPGRSSERSWMS